MARSCYEVEKKILVFKFFRILTRMGEHRTQASARKCIWPWCCILLGNFSASVATILLSVFDNGKPDHYARITVDPNCDIVKDAVLPPLSLAFFRLSWWNIIWPCYPLSSRRLLFYPELTRHFPNPWSPPFSRLRNRPVSNCYSVEDGFLKIQVRSLVWG